MARDIVAIDVHVHLSDEASQKSKGDRTAQMARYFGRERPPVSIDEMADQYRARKMMAVIMNTRDETDHRLDAAAQRSRRRRREKTSRRFPGLWRHRSLDRQAGARRNQTLQGLGPFRHGRAQSGAPTFFRQRHALLPVVGTVRQAEHADPVPRRHGGGRRRHAGRHGHQAQIQPADPPGRSRRGLSGIENHQRPSDLAVDRGKLGDRPPQSELLHRSLRLGAEVFPRRAACTTSTRCCKTKRCSAPTGRPSASSAGWKNSARSI